MRRPVTGRLVNVNERPISNLTTTADESHSKLMQIVPRAVYRGEIYEIFVTDDQEAAPGGRMKRFSLVGHFEIEDGGFVRVGDHVSVAGKDIGTICGYNQCKALRAPELPVIHIYAKAKNLMTGRDLGLKLEDEVKTTPVEPK